MKANDAVMTGYLELAKKYHIQDISYRAFVGRIKKVTGIVVATSEMIAYHEADDDKMPDSVNEYYGWVESQVGDDVLLNLEREARPFFFHILEMHLLGFIPEEVLIKEFKPSKKMSKEYWVRLLEDVRLHKEVEEKALKKSKTIKKAKAKSVAPKNLKELISIYVPNVLVKPDSKGDLKLVIYTKDSPIDVLLNTARCLLECNAVTAQVPSNPNPLVVESSTEFAIHLIWQKTDNAEILFSIDQDFEVRIAD